MDQLLPLLMSAFSGSGPTGIVLGAVALVAYQWARTKWPRLPNILPAPAPSPAPEPGPAPAPSTGRPLLDALLKILGPRAEQVLAAELHRTVSEIPPEPAKPVT